MKLCKKHWPSRLETDALPFSIPKDLRHCTLHRILNDSIFLLLGADPGSVNILSLAQTPDNSKTTFIFCTPYSYLMFKKCVVYRTFVLWLFHFFMIQDKKVLWT